MAKNFKRISLYFILFSLISVSFLWLKDSIFFMPKEYKTLKDTVDKLRSKNYLGSFPILFTITSGSSTSLKLEELGICEKNNCDLYEELNPYVDYKGKNSQEVNESIRQSILFNGIDAKAYSHGTISISRSTFINYENNEPFLACLLAHEISHVKQDHQFKENLKLYENKENKNNLNDENLVFKFSRYFEKEADNFALEMVYKSGYQIDTCIDNYQYLAKKHALSIDTKEASTHPGYIERLQNLKDHKKIFINNINEKKSKEFTKGFWKYNKRLNFIQFIPTYKDWNQNTSLKQRTNR